MTAYESSTRAATARELLGAANTGGSLGAGGLYPLTQQIWRLPALLPNTHTPQTCTPLQSTLSLNLEDTCPFKSTLFLLRCPISRIANLHPITPWLDKRQESIYPPVRPPHSQSSSPSHHGPHEDRSLPPLGSSAHLVLAPPSPPHASPSGASMSMLCSAAIVSSSRRMHWWGGGA